MQQYIWKNGQLLPENQAMTHVMTHALHYGSAVFEGIRAYETMRGLAILKLKEHMQRFDYSMKALGMATAYSVDELCQAVIDTVRASGLKSCYIRPLAYYGHGGIGVLPKDGHPVDIIVAVMPMGRYLGADAVDVKISKYIRIHPRSTVADAKISGHYINSILASMETKGTHYHESLLLDIDGNVAEGSAQNIFIVKDGTLYTTPLGTILKGITRELIIDIAKHLGYGVVEQYFKPQDIINADEAFFCGTAVEVSPIASIDDQKVAGSGAIGKITAQIAKEFHNIACGKTPSDALTYIDKITVKYEL
ncbi:MAG: branched-chain amino acid transaminase [Francisellaceae bacterium]